MPVNNNPLGCKVAKGSYTGNASGAQRNIATGLTGNIDHVHIQSSDQYIGWAIRGATNTIYNNGTSWGANTQATTIQPLTDGTFNVGGASNIFNSNAITYYWVTYSET